MFAIVGNLLRRLFGKNPDADAERYQMPKGLSRKEMKQVKKIIENAKGDDSVPRTAQQSIPFQRMFPDGICRVSDKYYTKTIQFQDINYQLAQQEDTLYEE